MPITLPIHVRDFPIPGLVCDDVDSAVLSAFVWRTHVTSRARWSATGDLRLVVIRSYSGGFYFYPHHLVRARSSSPQLSAAVDSLVHQANWFGLWQLLLPFRSDSTTRFGDGRRWNVSRSNLSSGHPAGGQIGLGAWIPQTATFPPAVSTLPVPLPVPLPSAVATPPDAPLVPLPDTPKESTNDLLDRVFNIGAVTPKKE